MRIFRTMREKNVSFANVIYVAHQEFDATPEFWKSGDYAVENIVMDGKKYTPEFFVDIHSLIDDDVLEGLVRTSRKFLRQIARLNDVETHRDCYEIAIDSEEETITVTYPRKDGVFRYPQNP